jgi:hypothetical protein
LFGRAQKRHDIAGGEGECCARDTIENDSSPRVTSVEEFLVMFHLLAGYYSG